MSFYWIEQVIIELTIVNELKGYFIEGILYFIELKRYFIELN